MILSFNNGGQGVDAIAKISEAADDIDALEIFGISILKHGAPP